MDWKKTVAKYAPTVGALFGAPGVLVGATIRKFLTLPETSSDDEVSAALLSPEGQEKIRLKEIELSSQLVQANSDRIESVNKTMRVESKSEHWMQWAWRPFNGFLFAITLFANYGLPSMFNSLISPFLETRITLSAGTIPPEALMAWGAVLGVTAWHRGKEKIAKHGQ